MRRSDAGGVSGCGERQVAHLVAGLVRVAGLERLVPAAEERALAQFPGERGVLRHRHVGRQHAGEAGLHRDDRAHGRVITEGGAEPAGQDPVGRRLVVVILVAGRAHQADLVHRPGHLRQQFADLQAGDVGGDGAVLAADLLRGVGLGVERVVVGKAAAEEDEDDRLGAGARGGAGRGVLEPGRDGLLTFQQAGQREAQRPEPAHAEEVAAGDAVAKPAARASQGDVDHESPSVRIILLHLFLPRYSGRGSKTSRSASD